MLEVNVAYAKRYHVTTQGRVFNVESGYELKQRMWGRYLSVWLTERGTRGKTFSVHRLVAEAYLPNPLKKRTVNHMNLNKLDNRTTNLEWATYLENTRHAIRNGRRAKTTGVGRRGFISNTGFRGVTLDKGRKRFKACISVNGCTKNLGWFKSAKDAAKVYDLAAKETYIRPILNFPT